MIFQIGAFFGSLVSGIGSVASQVITAAAPGAVNLTQQFLQRELNRKLQAKQRAKVGAQAVAALNTPGISVARVGGTSQPVGGRVQRSTFSPTASTPAQSPIGNIPLLPVGAAGLRLPIPPFPGPFAGFGTMNVPGPPFLRSAAMANGQLARIPQAGALATVGAPGEPRFARDQFGNTIMFVPSPRPGEGFISVAAARQLSLRPTKPFWRFNRFAGQFEKIKSRRLNPFNFQAAKRAGHRIERTLDAVKELVRIERKMSSGKVRLKKSKKRKR